MTSAAWSPVACTRSAHAAPTRGAFSSAASTSNAAGGSFHDGPTPAPSRPPTGLGRPSTPVRRVGGDQTRSAQDDGIRTRDRQDRVGVTVTHLPHPRHGRGSRRQPHLADEVDGSRDPHDRGRAPRRPRRSAWRRRRRRCGPRSPTGHEHERVAVVAAGGPRVGVGGPQRTTTVRVVAQRAEHRAAVVARQAQPVDAARGGHQRGGTAIAQDRVVLDRSGHPRIMAGGTDIVTGHRVSGIPAPAASRERVSEHTDTVAAWPRTHPHHPGRLGRPHLPLAPAALGQLLTREPGRSVRLHRRRDGGLDRRALARGGQEVLLDDGCRRRLRRDRPRPPTAGPTSPGPTTCRSCSTTPRAAPALYFAVPRPWPRNRVSRSAM